MTHDDVGDAINILARGHPHRLHGMRAQYMPCAALVATATARHRV